MLYYALKVVVSALIIVAITEIAKRSTAFAALAASLPITSLMIFVWLHVGGFPTQQIGQLSTQIFWLILPSLILFLLLPLLLRHGLGFWLSFTLSISATVATYLVMLPLLRRMGVGL